MEAQKHPPGKRHFAVLGKAAVTGHKRISNDDADSEHNRIS
jgi:hypothetical protein